MIQIDLDEIRGRVSAGVADGTDISILICEVERLGSECEAWGRINLIHETRETQMNKHLQKLRAMGKDAAWDGKDISLHQLKEWLKELDAIR